MTQSPPSPPLGPRPAPLALIDYAALTLLAAAIFFFVLLAILPAAVEVVVAICWSFTLLTYLILLPCCLLHNYWRPPHIVILLIWAPVLWMTGFLTSISLLYVAHYLQLNMKQHGYLTLAWGLLVVTPVLALALYRARKLRSDQFLARILLWYIALAAFGFLEIVAVALGLQSDDRRTLVMSSSSVISLAILLGLPSAACLLILRFQGRYGKTPVNLPHCTRCDYNLTGTALANQPLCPECGNPIPQGQLDWIHQNQPSPAKPA